MEHRFMTQFERDGYFIFIRKQNFHGEWTSTSDLQEFLGSQSPYVTTEELMQEHDTYLVAQLEISARQFRQDNDLLSAFNVIMLCEALNLYPTRDVLEWMTSGFRELDRNNYKQDLRKILGITGGRGQNPIREALIRGRNDYLYDIMGLLIRFFNMGVKDAAGLVWAREASNGNWDHIGVFPDAMSLEKGYPYSSKIKTDEFDFDDFLSSIDGRLSFAESFDVPGVDPKLMENLKNIF
jgi:hypothetical protein